MVSTNYRSICHNMSLIALTNMSIIESLLSTPHRSLAWSKVILQRLTTIPENMKYPQVYMVCSLVPLSLPSLMPHHDLVSAEIEPVRTDMIRINELFTRLHPDVIRLRTFYTRHHVTTLQSHMLTPSSLTTNNSQDAQLLKTIDELFAA